MWLLLQTVFNQISHAYTAGLTPSVEEQANYEARFFSESDEDTPRLLTIAGDSAEVNIRGTLTNRPNFMSNMFGGGNTTYSDIIMALAVAEQDPNVKNITLAIDSPGGEFAGLFEVLEAIDAVTKPTKALVSNVAASAACAIASRTDTIEAVNRAVQVGSVGVVATFHVFGDEVQITSTDAPNKAPDVTTEAGKEAIRNQLDEMHTLFAEAIATGRDTTIENVNKTFGQGGIFLSNEALARGMIDSIAPTALKSVPTSTQPTSFTAKRTPTEADDMNISELQAAHPGIYEAAVAVGIAQERDRVLAHLMLGQSSGDMKTAASAIESGSEMTATLQATYMAAGMNRTDLGERAGDDVVAAAAADTANAETSTNVETVEDKTVALLEANMGLNAIA